MTNSGYTAIGHLIATQPQDKYCKTFKHFLIYVLDNVDLQDLIIGKTEAMQLFDNFMTLTSTNGTPALSQYINFIHSFLRKSDTDEIAFQKQVERMVWELVWFNFTSKKDDPSNYKIFCLFNRFCDNQSFPMKIKRNDGNIILAEIKSAQSIFQDATLEDFMDVIYDTDHATNLYSLEKLNSIYSEIVHYILHRDTNGVEYKIVNQSRRLSMLKSKVGTRSKSSEIRITNRHLMIYETDFVKDEKTLVRKLFLLDAQIEGDGAVDSSVDPIRIQFPYENVCVKLYFDNKVIQATKLKKAMERAFAMDKLKTNPFQEFISRKT